MASVGVCQDPMANKRGHGYQERKVWLYPNPLRIFLVILLLGAARDAYSSLITIELSLSPIKAPGP